MLVGVAAAVCVCATLVFLVARGPSLKKASTPEFTFGPVETYEVSAAKDTRITDSVTGRTLRFPEGGKGKVRIAEITSGPAAPVPGEGISIDYKGNTRIQLMLEDKGDIIEVWSYGTHPVYRHSTWLPMTERQSEDGYIIYDLPMPSQQQATLHRVPLASLPLLAFPQAPAASLLAVQLAPQTSKYGQFWISRLKPEDKGPIRELYIRNEISDTVGSMIQTLPAGLQKPTLETVRDDFRWEYANVNAEDNGYQGFSPYVTSLRRPEFDLSADPNDQGRLSEIPHEVGHYIHHILLGDDRYREVLDRDSQRPKYVDHECGYYWPGRTFWLEEPATWAMYVLGADAFFDEPWASGKYVGKRPDKVDLPAVECFPTTFMAALTRSEDQITIPDATNKLKKVDIPTIRLTYGEVWELIRNVSNVNELHTAAEDYIKRTRGDGEAEKLSAIAGRIGWSYTIKGRLVDGSGKPLGLSNVQAVSRAAGHDYEGGAGMTASDGTFLLDNVFPGSSFLRLKIGDQTCDAPIRVNWNLPTNETVDLKDVQCALNPAKPAPPAAGGCWVLDRTDSAGSPNPMLNNRPTVDVSDGSASILLQYDSKYYGCTGTWRATYAWTPLPPKLVSNQTITTKLRVELAPDPNCKRDAVGEEATAKFSGMDSREIAVRVGQSRETSVSESVPPRPSWDMELSYSIDVAFKPHGRGVFSYVYKWLDACTAESEVEASSNAAQRVTEAPSTATPTAAPPPPTTTPTVAPTSEAAIEEKFFEVWSTGVADNGATVPTTFEIDQAWKVTQILTYHWNDGQGKAPGTVGLRAADGAIYGPWQAVGVPGNGGLPNAAWYVTPNVVIPPGAYTVLDSDPGSWAYNSETGGAGMAYGIGVRVSAPAPVLTPASVQPSAQIPDGLYTFNWDLPEDCKKGEIAFMPVEIRGDTVTIDYDQNFPFAREKHYLMKGSGTVDQDGIISFSFQTEYSFTPGAMGMGDPSLVAKTDGAYVGPFSSQKGSGQISGTHSESWRNPDGSCTGSITGGFFQDWFDYYAVH